MEAFDRWKSTRTSYNERSGNPEFEWILLLNSREVSRRPEEEGALQAEANPRPQTRRKPRDELRNHLWAKGGDVSSSV
jgi:hypothetical protein